MTLNPSQNSITSTFSVVNSGKGRGTITSTPRARRLVPTARRLLDSFRRSSSSRTAGVHS